MEALPNRLKEFGLNGWRRSDKYWYVKNQEKKKKGQSTGAVEYTDNVSAEG